MGQGLLHKVIDILVRIARNLGAPKDCCDFERIAITVHRIMSYSSRQFHTLEHVFNFIEGADDITILAAIFHDLVYLQVDEGLPPDARSYLEPFVLNDEGLCLNGAVQDDEDFELCRIVFGRDMKNNALQGMNEFLSALLMLKLMGKLISRKALVAVVVCIEASIPFRKEVAAPLEKRLRMLFDKGFWGLELEDFPPMIHRAIAFANKDVSDFIHDDPAAFLSNTWKLLPETNVALRRPGAYNIREYRTALYNQMKFFRSLDPSDVFHQYAGQPSDGEMVVYVEKITINLTYAVQYLKAKLLAVGAIEAMAMLSGGDAPVALFMGDLPCDGAEQDTLLKHLSPRGNPSWLDQKHPVVRLLRDGRLESSFFDLKHSPLALWLYSKIEPQLWKKLEECSEQYFEGERDAKSLLNCFPQMILKELIPAASIMVPTRKDRLLSLS